MLHTTHFCFLRIGLLCLFLQCLVVLANAQNQAGLLNITAVNGATSAKAGQTIRLNVTVKNTGTISSKPDSLYVGQTQQGYQYSYIHATTNRVAIPAIAAGAAIIFPVDFMVKDPFLVGATITFNTSLDKRGTTFVGLASKAVQNYAFVSIESVGGFSYPITPILPKVKLDMKLTTSNTVYTAGTIPKFTITITNTGTETAKAIAINYPCAEPIKCLSLTVSKGKSDYYFIYDSRLTPPFATPRYWVIDELKAGETATAEARLEYPPVGFGGKPDDFFTNDVFNATLNIQSVLFDNIGTKTASLIFTKAPNTFPTNAVIGTMTAEPATSKQWGYNKITVNIENTTDAAIPNALVSFNFPPADIAIATDADKKPVATIGTVLSFGPWDIGTLPARSKHTLVFYVFVRTSDKAIEITTTFHNKQTLAYYTVSGAAVTLQPVGIVQPPNPPAPTGNVALTMTADPTTYTQWGYNKITITVENKTGADIPQANVSLGASSYEDVVFATEASKKGIVSIGTATQYIWTLGSFAANAKHTWIFYTFAKTSGKPLTIYSYFHKVLNQAGHDATTTVVLQPKGTTPPTSSGTKPDLSIENFKLVSPISIMQGQLGYFTFDLKNTGAPVFGDYTLGVYIYPPREPNKAILVGAIPTGNTPIGTIINVKGDFTTIIDDKIASGNYILSIKIDDKNIVNESNEANNEVLSNIFISPRLVSDLQVTMTTTPAQYKQYSNQTLQITVKNNGTQTTNGIKVSFDYLLSALPYVNNEASTGVYNQITKIWNIGTMNGNQSATLKLVLFPLVKDQDLPVKATLVPTDTNPTNNIATVTLKPVLITTRSPKDIVPTQVMPIIVQSLFPNPAENDIFFRIESLDEREVMFEIRDSFGKIIQREATKMTSGENQVLLHIENLPQGLYFVTPITSNSRLLPLKLMKL